MTANFQAKLDIIRQRFLSVLDEREQSILAAIGSFESGRNLRPALQSAQMDLHKIAGTAAPLGFRELGDQAIDLETQIIAQLASADADLSHLKEGLAEVVRTITSIKQNASLLESNTSGVSA